MLSRSLKGINKLLCYKKLFVQLNAPTSCMGLSVKFFVAAVSGSSLGLGCEQSSLRAGGRKGVAICGIDVQSLLLRDTLYVNMTVLQILYSQQ